MWATISKMIVNIYGPQSPAYSLSTAKRELSVPRQAAMNPGPGYYSTQSPLNRKGYHQISLPQSKRFSEPEAMPGPGDYDIGGGFDSQRHRSVSQKSVTDDPLRSRSPSGQLLSSKYPPTKITIPGPGSYNTQIPFKLRGLT